MANSLGAAADKMTRRLDKIIEAETKTADLNMNSELLGEFSQAGSIEIAKLGMNGLGEYKRDTGFTHGDVTLDWEQHKLRFDRGREFSVDTMDDEERVLAVSANLMAEFERTQVIPEVDAVRFATLCENADAPVSATLSTDADVKSAVMAAEEKMQDLGSELSQLVLYCTSAVKGSLRRTAPYNFGRGDDPTTNFDTYDDMKVVVVPGKRFYSKVKVLDGVTSGEEAGGFQKGDGGFGINFLLVDPSACAAIQKHATLRYFAPEINQGADAHLWQYRLYHDLLVYENKKELVYAHVKAA